MKKKVVILGSTGSIGKASLEVIKRFPEQFTVIGLSAGNNLNLLQKQAAQFKVDMLALSRPGKKTQKNIAFTGEGSSADLVKATCPDIVVNAITGAAGFLPSLEAIRQKSRLCLANKESLVIGGKFITREAKKKNTEIIPVDSEHSAIFQCLMGEKEKEISRIILTASGGPFRKVPKKEFKHITPSQALKHPTWKMGKRITIDSATMMNKALEIIEASWLFNVPVEKLDVVIHPQSIIHSMVEFNDSSTKAQMGIPDMRLPIAYALFWPERFPVGLKTLDFTKPLALEFIPPDKNKFPALELGKQAMTMPDVLPCIMNAADEVAVDAFLNKRIRFDQIVPLVKKVMERLSDATIISPDDLLELDKHARVIARECS